MTKTQHARGEKKGNVRLGGEKKNPPGGEREKGAYPNTRTEKRMPSQGRKIALQNRKRGRTLKIPGGMLYG